MITIPKSRLGQVQYLIEQSMQGNHVLFEPDTLRRVLRQGCQRLSEDESYAVEPLLEKLLELPTLETKREFLNSLDEQTLDRVVQTYFTLIENRLYEDAEVRH